MKAVSILLISSAFVLLSALEYPIEKYREMHQDASMKQMEKDRNTLSQIRDLQSVDRDYRDSLRARASEKIYAQAEKNLALYR